MVYFEHAAVMRFPHLHGLKRLPDPCRKQSSRRRESRMSKLKSKVLSVVAGVLVASSLVGAQAAQNPVKIKKVRQQITLSQDVKVGTTVLKSGRYEVSSDDQGLTFRHLVPDSAYADQWMRDSKVKPVVVKATATLLEAKSRGMQMDVAPPDSSGVPVLKAISLDDTNIKFTIEQ